MKSREVYSNLIWRMLERFGAHGVTFVVSIILARFLDPEVYAVVAIVNVLIGFFNVFLDNGFSVALVQKKDADDTDFSSVFYFGVAFSVAFYLLLFFTAPLIAAFYRMEQLTSVIRVLGILLIIYSLKSVQQAYVTRNMMFRKFFFSTLGGTIGAAVIGVAMAVMGFGVWALVAQSIFNMLVDTVILWLTVKWRPKAVFSFARLKMLLSYGWKLFAAALLDTIFRDIRQLVIGKQYSSSDLAFYNRGFTMASLLGDNINGSIGSVLFPAMSKEQDHPEEVKRITKRAIRVSSYLMAPVMVGMAVCAEPFVRFFLTEKWLPSVPYIQIFALIFIVYPFHTANLSAQKAVGRSDIYLKYEVVRKIVDAVSIAVTIWFGPLVIAFGTLAGSLVVMYVNARPNKKLIGYGFLEQLGDFLPNVGMALLMGIGVSCVPLLKLPDWVTLILQVLFGVLIYYGLSKLFHVQSFDEIFSLIRDRKKEKQEENRNLEEMRK